MMTDIALIFFHLDIGGIEALLPGLTAPTQVVDEFVQIMALLQPFAAALLESFFGLIGTSRFGLLHFDILSQLL